MNSQSTVNQGGRFTNVTPLPWTYTAPNYAEGESGMGAFDSDGRRLFNTGVCSPFPLAEAQANAAFIVEAVNSYAANLERIRELEIALGALIPWVDKAVEVGAFKDCAGPLAAERLADEARAALKGD